MATILVATDSIHTTAAACDYLESRVGDTDTVLILTATNSETSERDAGDAANVARTRLIEPAIETVTAAGEPAAVVQTVAEEHDVDQLVVGQYRGDPATAGDPPGSTVQALLATSDRPVVVVPIQ